MGTYKTVDKVVNVLYSTLDYIKRPVVAGALGLAMLAGCAPNPRRPLYPESAAGGGVAARVYQAGLDLEMDFADVSEEELTTKLKGECDLVLSMKFFRDGSINEPVISCELNQGERTENKWRLNLYSLSNVLYRDRDVAGIVDIDWMRKDEVYIVTDRGNAFSLYMDEEHARTLVSILEPFVRRNAKNSIDVARMEEANYSSIGPLPRSQRRERTRMLASRYRNGQYIGSTSAIPGPLASR